MKRFGLPRPAAAYALVLALLAVPAAAGTPQLFGFVRLGAGGVDSTPSFLAGGSGKTRPAPPSWLLEVPPESRGWDRDSAA